MRDTLYRQMVYWIREYRTWIEVVDDNFYKEYLLSRNGYINYIVSRTLVLRAYKDKGSYAKGMTWTIPEHKLDKALAAYRKQEHTFKQRIKKDSDIPFTEGRRSYHPIGHPQYCPIRVDDIPHSNTRETLLFMIWNILQLIFCITLFVLPLALYKSHRSFMVRFYDAMIHSVKARKLYVQIVLILLLLFHYVYISGHVGEFGVFLFNCYLCHYIFI